MERENGYWVLAPTWGHQVMRKKQGTPSELTDTPVRRSTRLQQENVGEKVYSLAVKPEGRPERGKPRFAHQGFLYVFDKESLAEEGLLFWRCARRGRCKARLHTKDGVVVRQMSQHSHDAVPGPTEQGEFTSSPSRRAAITLEPPIMVQSEPQRSQGRQATDILQPRESIRAYKKQVDPPKHQPRDPLVLPEPGAARALGPRVETEGLSPEEPNLQGEMGKEKRPRLQVLEAAKKAEPRGEGATLSLQSPAETQREPRQVAWRRTSPRSNLPAMEQTGLSQQPPFRPARETHKTQPRRFLPWRPLFFLLLFLTLSFTCGFVWKYGLPGFLRGHGTHGLVELASGLWTWKHFAKLWSRADECGTQCSLVLLESIPESLQYQPFSPQNPTIYQAWTDLLQGANGSVEIAAFYFTLRDSDLHLKNPSAKQGMEVFELLRDLPSRGVKLKIAVNSPQLSEEDTNELAHHGADVRYVNMEKLTGGIVHTKLWVVDRKHIYIGSANMDWRSLTKVKELGVVLYNCSCLARDLHRIFAMYRILGKEGAAIPATWPTYLAAESRLGEPLKVQLNGEEAEVYISSSPPALCSAGRTSDLDAILSTIQDAEEFVYISVMDYEPQCLYCKPKRFWPLIDDALRTVACDKRVAVRLLISCWKHSKHSMFVFLKSLLILQEKPLGCPIEVKLFVVPTEGEEIPFAHVNHNKYMVTDRVAYIGTSNWSEDYFAHTTGVGLVINQSTLAPEAQISTVRQQLVAVFLRDWDSVYSLPLESHWDCMEN